MELPSRIPLPQPQAHALFLSFQGPASNKPSLSCPALPAYTSPTLPNLPPPLPSPVCSLQPLGSRSGCYLARDSNWDGKLG